MYISVEEVYQTCKDLKTCPALDIDGTTFLASKFKE